MKTKDKTIKKKEAITTLDSWSGLISKIQEQQSKVNLTNQYQAISDSVRLRTEYLQQRYMGNSLFQIIIDVWADYAVSKSIEFEIEDKKKNEKLEQKVKEIEKNFHSFIRNKRLEIEVNKALKMNNRDGSSLIVFIFESDNDTTDFTKKVDYSTIRDIRKVIVFEKDNITRKILNDTSEYELFEVNNGTVANTYHASRCIFFNGIYKGETALRDNNGFGESIINPDLDQVISNLDSRNKVLNELLAEMKLDVMYIKNLYQKITNKSDEEINSFFEVIAQQFIAKNIFGCAVLDASDKMERLNSSTLAGAIELVTQAENELVIKSKIPSSILLGQLNAGLTTGAGAEAQNGIFYGRVRSYQEYYLRPVYNTLIKMFAGIYKLSDKYLNLLLQFEFKPLYEQSELEDAQEDKLEAETESIKLDNKRKELELMQLESGLMSNVNIGSNAAQSDNSNSDSKSTTGQQKQDSNTQSSSDIGMQDGAMND